MAKKDNLSSTIVYGKRQKGGGSEVPSALNASLKVVSGKDAGKSFRLTAANTVIGRGDQADVRIDDEGSSRQHAAVVYRNLEFRVKDLDSANGTFLNGSEVKEYALRSGDKIAVGGTILQFRVEEGD